jgi:ferredoxin-nitrite reductase
MANLVEAWKREKHGFDVWPDVLAHARARTPMPSIPGPDLERMKWYGVFYRKRDAPGSYMLRIRITANELSATQAKEIARIAYDLGYGIVDITTRANIQVQGLAIEDVPRALQRLEAVGLNAKQTGLDNVRNVFAHPLSGVDPDELIDTRSLCREITNIFIDNRKLADLPRKFNIATCGRAEHAIHYWTQDLSFLAAMNGERVEYRMVIGGKQGQMPRLGRPLPVWVAPQQAPRVARAVLELFHERGTREKRDSARFHFLIEQVGEDGVLEAVERRLGGRLQRCDEELVPPSRYEELVGWFRQKRDRSIAGAEDVRACSNSTQHWAMGLCPALGRMSWMQLEGVAIASARWGNGQLRTTPEQGLMVLNVRGGFRDALATQLAQWNLSVHADSRTRNTVACTGKQFCNIAVTETKAHALRLIEQLRQRSLELHGIRIHMSGCPSACANHHTADIGLKGVRVKRLLGTREGFDVFLGGGMAGRLSLASPYRMGVDVDQLPQLIDEVVREFYLRGAPGQTFSDYWRHELARRAPSAAKEEDYKPATWECDICRYRHLGDDPPVYCPQCAALRRHFARWESEHEETVTNGGEYAPARFVVDPNGYAEAADVAAVVDGQGLLVQLSGQEVALFRLGSDIFAIDNTCPHAGGSLAEGTVTDGCVTCPLHGWKFDVRTGDGISPAMSRVASYATKIVDGKIMVQAAPRDASAMHCPAISAGSSGRDS